MDTFFPDDIQTTTKLDSNIEVIPRFDGWANVFTGLGGVNDKSSYTKYGRTSIIDDDTLALIYAGDGLGGRIIDIVADDMTREWIAFDGDEKAIETLQDDIDRLSAEEHFNKALKWQRLFGGSIIVVGAMDGRSPETPLNPKAVKSIEYLKAIDRTSIPISECIFDEDSRSPNFGNIKIYKINYFINNKLVPMYVHASRVLPFYNDPVPGKFTNLVDYTTRYWGMSSLQRIYEELRDLGGITQSTVNILMEFIIGKFKISHLAEMLAAGQEQKVVKRIEIMNRSKSTINAVLLGDDEEYTRDYATLAGLPEVIDRFMLKLSGSTGIPVTRLFGRSPAGLNATGENDLRNYYDLVEAQQRNRLKTPIRKLVDLLAIANNIPKPPKFVFNPLYQLSQDEQAKIENLNALTEKSKADTEAVYVAMGALDVLDVSKEHGWTPPEAEEFEPPEGELAPDADPEENAGKSPKEPQEGRPVNKTKPKAKAKDKNE